MAKRIANRTATTDRTKKPSPAIVNIGNNITKNFKSFLLAHDNLKKIFADIMQHPDNADVRYLSDVIDKAGKKWLKDFAVIDPARIYYKTKYCMLFLNCSLFYVDIKKEPASIPSEAFAVAVALAHSIDNGKDKSTADNILKPSARGQNFLTKLRALAKRSARPDIVEIAHNFESYKNVSTATLLHLEALAKVKNSK